MYENASPVEYASRATTAADSRPLNLSHLAQSEALLPFTVNMVRNRRDMEKAVSIRHAAYARHVPEFAQTLRTPESMDYDEGVLVLLAESKVDGSPLGTMRIQTNDFGPLGLEHSMKLPPWLQQRRLAEATRLGVTADKTGRLVTMIMFKAFYLYCLQSDIDWMVITARAPVDRQYERLLFQDVDPQAGYVAQQHIGNIPHRVMCFNVKTAKERWARANHPLLGFMCDTHHPDIQIDAEQVAKPTWRIAYPSGKTNLPSRLSAIAA